MLASHGNVDLLIDWLKADIPWRVKELKEDTDNFNIYREIFAHKETFYYSSTRLINTSAPKLMKHNDIAYTRSLSVSV